MTSLSNIAIGVAVGAVGLVLAAGFVNTFRGGGGSMARSQKLMRWRVGLQLLALILVMTVIYARGRW